MKKIVSLAVLAALTTTVAGAAAPSHLVRNNKGGYDVTFNYADKAKTGWYVRGRVALSLLNWENEATTDAPDASDLKNESFTEFLFGGNLFAGRRINYFWRAELEAGLIGQYEEEDLNTTFKLTVPYVMANAYYDFSNGIYLGAGAGVAMPKTELTGGYFTGGDSSERNVSPMFGLMAGYSHKLDSNLVVDFRYRLAGLWGTEQKREFGAYELKNKIGLILDNSISLGLRYEF
jgi:opacity protein-like surface antigen